MREILTVSLGNYANHVNAHYWNFQDELAGVQVGTAAEVDHEVLFRATEDAAGETAYVPRVVILDTKGSLGSLSRLGGPRATPAVHIHPLTDSAHRALLSLRSPQVRCTTTRQTQPRAGTAASARALWQALACGAGASRLSSRYAALTLGDWCSPHVCCLSAREPAPNPAEQLLAEPGRN